MRNPFRLFARLTRLVVPAALAFLVLGPSSANAQSQPLVSYVLPAGGQRGTTAEVAVRGRYLIGATGIYISGKGISGKVVDVTEPDKGKRRPQRLDAAKYPHQARLAVTIAPDAEVGERDLRVITPGGVSNRFRFFVGQAPEVTEADESDALSQEALVLESIPVVANGQIYQADSDIYRFKAKAGQTLVFDVDAQSIINYIADGVPGWIQPSLRLNDAQGNELAYVDDFQHHPDPLMIYKVPKDGECSDRTTTRWTIAPGTSRSIPTPTWPTRSPPTEIPSSASRTPKVSGATHTPTGWPSHPSSPTTNCTSGRITRGHPKAV